MKKIFMAIALCLIAVLNCYANATNHTYVKCNGSIEQYASELLIDTAEIIVVYEVDSNIVAIYDASKGLGNSTNAFFARRVGSTITCDSKYAFNAHGKNDYYCVTNDGKSLSMSNDKKYSCCIFQKNDGFGIVVYGFNSSSVYSYYSGVTWTINSANEYFGTSTSYTGSNAKEQAKGLCEKLSIYRYYPNKQQSSTTGGNTTIVTEYVHDTIVVTNTETQYVHDTINNFYIDTICVHHHDTTNIVQNIYVTDTAYLVQNIYINDTAYITQNVYLHDTTYMQQNVYVYDTITMTENVYLHDTAYIAQNVYVHDTAYVNLTNYVYLHDTLTNNVYVYLHDTIEAAKRDTIYLPQYITIHDTTTEYVTDTIYETIYLESDGTALTYALEDYGVTYFYGQVVNLNGISIKLYSADGKLVATSNENISMANKQRGVYLVTDGNGGYMKFIY